MLAAELLFDLVEIGDESDDTGGVSFSGVEGFAEAAPNVGEAPAECDVCGVKFLIGGVDAEAVGLKGAAPVAVVVPKGCFEVGTAPAVLPKVAYAALQGWIIKRPNVSGVGFTSTGGEFFDGTFVNLKVVLAEAFLVDRFGDRTEEFEALERPVIQGIAGCVKAESLEDGLLPVDGKVVGKL